MKRILFKILSWTFFVVAGFVILAALLVVEENWRGKRVWEQCKRDLEAQGEHLDFAYFIPPPVPDDQNFAMTSLLKPLLEYTIDPKTREVIYRDPNPPVKKISVYIDESPSEIEDAKIRKLGIEKYLNEIIAKPLSAIQAARPRQKGGWPKGAFRDLKEWQNYYRVALPNMVHPQSPAGDVLAVIGRFDKVYLELREAAKTHPLSRFSLHEKEVQMRISYYTVLQNVEMTAALRASAELSADSPDDALEDVQFGFRVMESFGKEELFIPDLTRVSFVRVLIQPIWDGLASHRWTNAQLEIIQAQLEKIDMLSDYERCLRTERALSAGTLDLTRSDPAKLVPVEGFRRIRLLFFAKIFNFWLYQNEAYLFRVIQDKVIPLINKTTQCVDVSQFVRTQDFFKEQGHHFSPSTAIARASIPVYFSVLQKNAETQTRLNQAIIACAIEQYRLAHGALPATLNDLHMANLPYDIINGEPMHYRITGDDNYILYSVGWNGTDDGGKIVEKNNGIPDFTQGDCVWSLKPL